MKINEVDIIELFDSYVALRELEDKSDDCYGNVEYLISILSIPDDIIKLFNHVYDVLCEARNNV